jgi:hypothetical protein
MRRVISLFLPRWPTAEPGPRLSSTTLAATKRGPGSAAHRFARATRCAASGARTQPAAATTLSAAPETRAPRAALGR